MLKIKVLGTGLIPRGYGLAPRKEPFMADLTLIQTILGTCPNLKIYYLNPENGKFDQLTRKTMKAVWDRFSDYEKHHVIHTAPHDSVVKPVEPKIDPVTSSTSVGVKDVGVMPQTGTIDPKPATDADVNDTADSTVESGTDDSPTKVEESTTADNEQQPVILKPIHSDYNPNTQKHNNQNNGKHNKK